MAMCRCPVCAVHSYIPKPEDNMDHAEDFSISHNSNGLSVENNPKKVDLSDDPTVQAGKAAEEMNKVDRSAGEFEHDSYITGDREDSKETKHASSEQ